jgi:hypothetical protein
VDQVDTLPQTFCYDAHRCLTEKNAGGKSEFSEAHSIQHFKDRFQACDFLIEMEVDYLFQYKMVDNLCTMHGERVGVSVTRAMSFGRLVFTDEDAARLLRKKLYGLIVARNCVVPKLTFFKSVLHIWCQSQEIAEAIQRVYSSFDIDDFGLDVKGSLVLLVTVCTDRKLYNNRY